MKLAFKKYLVDDNEVEVNYYLKAVVLMEKLEGLYVYKHKNGVYSTFAYIEVDKKWFFYNGRTKDVKVLSGVRSVEKKLKKIGDLTPARSNFLGLELPGWNQTQKGFFLVQGYNHNRWFQPCSRF